MVEVFKTNVTDFSDAKMLVDEIHRHFTTVKANFDLDDCDRILRLKATADSILPALVIEHLEKLGFKAEVLPDELPATLEVAHV